MKRPRRPQKRRGPFAMSSARSPGGRSVDGWHVARLAWSRLDAPGPKKWLPAVRDQGRREEDEDEETREQEHRGGPRHDDGQAPNVDFHGPQTRSPRPVLRGSS